MASSNQSVKVDLYSTGPSGSGDGKSPSVKGKRKGRLVMIGASIMLFTALLCWIAVAIFKDTEPPLRADTGLQQPGDSSNTGTDNIDAPVVPLLKTVPVNSALGFFDPEIEFPLIPVAIAVLPSGKVLAWSAFSPDDFHREDRYVVGGGGLGKTQHAVWDPVAGSVTGMLVADTNHDMFCPGITMMANGDIMVTGGQNAKKASIYQLASSTWNEAPEMDISRGYGSSALLSDGRVFVLGGSWSGPRDLEKDAEVYDPTSGEWSSLPGIQAATILTKDPEDAQLGLAYRADNYGMFHPWSNGTASTQGFQVSNSHHAVFHAGPSTQMNWFSTDGEGSTIPAGTRPGGNMANGNSVMFDKGKILNCGGSEAYALPEYPATDFASLIVISEPNKPAEVRTLSPMKFPRTYANGVVLPDGKVFIIGGATSPKEFSDEFAVYQAEIWDPATENFTMVNDRYTFGRTYHSTAALLPDGRVFTGGGGLCGSGKDGSRSLCKGEIDPNHLNAEIFNPPYLFNADGTVARRPTITLSAATAEYGASLLVSSSEQLMMVSMIRMGSSTHSTNTDQRRLELCGPFTSPCTNSPITVQIPGDPGIALPGNWMIFGVNANGAPSVASILRVGI